MKTIRRDTVKWLVVPMAVLVAVAVGLRVEHTPRHDGTARVRVIFVGHPAADVPPKSIADEESREAAWFALDDLDDLPLRTPEVRNILRHAHHGGAVYPLGLIANEGWSLR